KKGGELGELNGNEPKEYLIDIPAELIQEASESIDLLLSKLSTELSITERALLLRRNIQKTFKTIEDKYTRTLKDRKASLNTGLLSLSIINKDLRVGYYYQLLENIRNDEIRLLTLEEL